jgi:transposase-like protein
MEAQQMEIPTKNIGNITEIRRGLIVAELATGATVQQVAKKFGMNPDPIYRWLKTSEGVRALQEGIGDANVILRNRLPTMVEQALNVLQRQLDSYDPDRAARAAKIILSVAAKLPSTHCEQCHARVINPSVMED